MIRQYTLNDQEQTSRVYRDSFSYLDDTVLGQLPCDTLMNRNVYEKDGEILGFVDWYPRLENAHYDVVNFWLECMVFDVQGSPDRRFSMGDYTIQNDCELGIEPIQSYIDSLHNDAHLRTLCVNAKAQRQGIGRKLFASIEHDKPLWWVSPHDSKPLDFYNSLGARRFSTLNPVFGSQSGVLWRENY